MNPLVDPYGRFVEFGRVDVYLDLECTGGEGCKVVAGLTDVESAAQDEQKVGILDNEISSSGANGSRAPTEQRMVG